MEEEGTVDLPDGQGTPDSEKTFSEVRRKRKREKDPDMDTSESTPAEAAAATPSTTKRPVFPPVNLSTSLVGYCSAIISIC